MLDKPETEIPLPAASPLIRGTALRGIVKGIKV
jgi:hypothetical protein